MTRTPKKTNWFMLFTRLCLAAWFGYLGMKVTGNAWAFWLFGYIALSLLEINGRLGLLDKRGIGGLVPTIPLSIEPSKVGDLYDREHEYSAARITYVVTLNYSNLIRWHFPNDFDEINKSYSLYLKD